MNQPHRNRVPLRVLVALPAGALILAASALVLTSCQMKSTSTARTAIEQALLSTAATRTVEQMDFKALNGKSFFIKEDKFEAVDGKFVMGEVRSRLLNDGLFAAAKEETADVLIWPRSAAHGIDESKFLLGIPAIPIPVPTVGTIQTPELALFKLDRQRGRDRTAIAVEDRTSGTLVADTGQLSSQCRYDRWVILVIFGWTSSNLGEPF